MQPQQVITVAAPAFHGMNTEESPLSLGPEWASIANNCVIDEYGRLGARKGHNILTTDNTLVGTSVIQVIHQHITTGGVKVVVSVGNNKIFTGTTTLVDVTPAGAVITANDWQIVSLNDDCFLFQLGHAPIAYDYSTNTWDEVISHPLYLGTVPQADVALSAYGRLWVANTSTNKTTISWSDLLIGPAWTGGSSGSIDVSKFWPRGADEVTALAAHNGYLIVFGRESILIYSGAEDDPATNLVLEDTIDGIGIVGKHAHCSVGADLLFVDLSGLRALSRVIQEKSLPVGDISKNVRRAFRSNVSAETGQIKTAHSPDDGFVLVTMPSLQLVWCFDTKFPLQDGSLRVTLWTGKAIYGIDVLQNGTLYFGNNDGILNYSGYLDDTATYRYRYYSAPLNFGQPGNLKIPKEMCMTITGGPAQKAVAYWGYDYIYSFKKYPFTLDAQDLDFYNTTNDEYNNLGDPDPDDPTEYTGGYGIKRYRIPLSGSGIALMIGLEIDVNNTQVSLQEIDIKALLGRIQ
jgi:hypothetical protein